MTSTNSAWNALPAGHQRGHAIDRGWPEAGDAALDMVDLQFPLTGRAVPLDYADALWTAVRTAMPALESDALAGVHHLYGLSPGADEWYLSRRSRLVLRLARAQVAAARAALEGAALEVDGQPLMLGAASLRELKHFPAIHAKFVAVGPADPGNVPIAEEVFMVACGEQLAAMELRPHIVCGKAQRAQTAAGLLSGFGLMLIGLSAAETMLLLRHGLGVERKHGCGIFVPHKSPAAVGTLE